MGLFINKSEHPRVFQHGGKIKEPNQSYYKSEYFSEILQEQKKRNESFAKGLRELRKRHQQFELIELGKWNDIGKQIMELKKSNSEHEQFELEAREWLQLLENNSQELQHLIANDSELTREMLEQIDGVSKSNEEIVKQIAKHESFSEQLNTQLNQLYELHQQMADQLSEQDTKQDQVLHSVENQEALMEKTFRQVDHIRSILYERTNYIAEKIENSYNLTSSLMYKLITGSEKPLTLMMAGKRKDNENGNTD
ncbi:hypothetical protein ACFSTA_04415 [Ornithinibacillus salinisoli]|uniref:t-SNARE coiled-coil homology domain-containing protein n=1 Tax=Ornithinibacillus salinisoli TaxID=1848459 RepID=A0ABW4VY34_9BACI